MLALAGRYAPGCTGVRSPTTAGALNTSIMTTRGSAAPGPVLENYTLTSTGSA
jgi:hypothetical protein